MWVSCIGVPEGIEAVPGSRAALRTWGLGVGGVGDRGALRIFVQGGDRPSGRGSPYFSNTTGLHRHLKLDKIPWVCTNLDWTAVRLLCAICRKREMEAQRRYENSREGRKRFEVTGFVIDNGHRGKLYCASTLDWMWTVDLPACFQIAEREWKALLAEADRNET